jgi:mannan endo-1,4-beta-mannosidase
VTQTLPATLGGFVQASGRNLVLDGQPFRIFGASIYQTSNHGHTADPDQIFAWAEAAGMNTVRLSDIFLQTTNDPGAPYAEADWVWIDGLIARARDKGMKVVLDLSSYRNWIVWSSMINEGVVADCQDDPTGHGVDFAALDPYTVERRAGWTQFMSFVANRINTVTGIPFRKDPTILVVSIAGEPVGPGFALCGKASTTQELTDFFTWALAEWKSLDPHHLRSTGGLHGTYGGLDENGDPIPSGQLVDGIALFRLADNTLPSLHTYPPPDSIELPLADGQTPVLAPIAEDENKPWFTEEFGFHQSDGDSWRATEFDFIYDEQTAYGSAGSLFWNLGPEIGSDTFDVNPSTPETWARVLAEAP